MLVQPRDKGRKVKAKHKEKITNGENKKPTKKAFQQFDINKSYIYLVNQNLTFSVQI
ncbi:Uncharacterized protein TCM_037454 [Theobroma cacao]|uniref:Uncharacterized protein n=1 Tax=Theobroma cacao TaxID=3641 RepID=A0A061GL70_THECC|nr:Uncharacterized protein TCM_037454 [Theobroma cacao]